MPPSANANRSPRSFTPPNDVATYRDLLLFEERLKSNAMNLQSRKSRYQRLLFVSVTTLVLFFASGMYEEKILYANKYVPHANRALRSFNMYLNVRKPPLRTKFRFNPLSFFFPRPASPPSPSSHSASQPATSTSTRRTRSPSVPPGATIPIPEIPPANNPRGELIFSSRVDRTFREGYERHRAAFERRREERERVARMGSGWVGVAWRGVGVVTRGRWGRKAEGKGTRAAGAWVGGAKEGKELIPLKGSSGSSVPLVRRMATGTTVPGSKTGIVMKQKQREKSMPPPGEGYGKREREERISAVGMEKSLSHSAGEYGHRGLLIHPQSHPLSAGVNVLSFNRLNLVDSAARLLKT
ncbi:hypothetical protein C0995_001184 [Termitomyces sp. Mi166|nr:hypothetical protein C0995_001184 [Termitomyces sp. Mi166\